MKYLRIVTWLAVLMLVWEMASRSVPGLHFVLPSPSAVFMGLWMHAHRFALHSVVTLQEMLGGLLLSLVVAVPIAGAMVAWRGARDLLHPIIVISQCLPMFALAPLMVIWFGWSYTSVVIPVVLMTFVPLTLSMYQGLRSVPQSFLDAFDTYGSTSWQTLLKLQLPWALPQIASGLRIAAAFAGLGAVAGEWAGGQQGLGVMMLESRRGADLVTAFGAIICVMVLSLAFYVICSGLESLAMRRRPLSFLWKESSSRKTLVFCLAGIVVMGATTRLYQEPSPPKAIVSVILDWVPNPNHIPLFVGVSEGIFAKHGIDLHILKVHDPGDVVPYLSAGQADIAVSYMTSLLLGAKQQGADFKVIGYLVKEPLNSLIYAAEEGIEDPKDLTGKVIGCATDGLQTQMLQRILALNGVTPKSLPTVNFDLVGFLLSRQVDAIFGAYWNIESEQLRSKGLDARYFRLEEDLGVPHHFELVLVAPKNSPLAQTSAIVRFRQALQEAMTFCREQPDRSFDLYVRANPDKTNSTLDWERLAWRKTLLVLAAQQDDELGVWQKYYGWLKDQGLIHQPFDLSELFVP